MLLPQQLEEGLVTTCKQSHREDIQVITRMRNLLAGSSKLSLDFPVATPPLVMENNPGRGRLTYHNLSLVTGLLLGQKDLAVAPPSMKGRDTTMNLPWLLNPEMYLDTGLPKEASRLHMRPDLHPETCTAVVKVHHQRTCITPITGQHEDRG